MVSSPGISPIAIRVMLLLTALILVGCSHAVLRVFFTGVPEPGAEQTETAVATAAVEAPRMTGSVIKLEQFLHGPYGATACNLCHLDRRTTSMSASKLRSAPGPGQQLAYPRETLCAGCHSEKAAAEVAASGLWQHGPVAIGWCTSCHNPHKTNRQFMLTQESNVDMCGQCHTAEALQRTAQHSSNPEADCMGCHNPHAGRSRFLLKAEYDERERFGGS